MNTAKAYNSMTMEQIIDTLEFAGVAVTVEATYSGIEFNRNIDFTVLGKEYRIEWYKNVSTLTTKDERGWQYPFHFVKFDDCFPIAGGNLTFSQERNHSYYSFRLPLPEPYQEAQHEQVSR